MFEQSLIYAPLIFLAGFIDSIAGGGGLITVPVLTLIMGPGADTIGTNKILATASTLMAVLIYFRKGHLELKGSFAFLITVLAGTVLGAKVAGFLPAEYFRWFMLVVCPILLIITLKKDSLVPGRRQSPLATPLICLIGLFVGFYDGVFGPGGGTFMFLSLVLFVGLPLMQAIAVSKLANLLSAAGSLSTYALDGHVHWQIGLPLAIFSLVGAFAGAQLAHKKAHQIVKPILVGVVLLLMLRLLYL